MKIKITRRKLRKHRPLRWKLLLWGMLVMAAAYPLAAAVTPLLGRWLFPYLAIRYSRFLPLLRYSVQFIMFTLLALIMLSIDQDNIVNRISKLSEAARRIADGDYNVQVRSTERLDEVYQLENDFNLMAAELQQTAYLRKDFISNVSHELKTPLSVIKGYADLLSDADDNELTPKMQQDYACIISRECRRLLNMTTNMLQLSRLDSESIPTDRSLFRLDEQLRQCILLLEPKWSTKQLNIDLQLDEDCHLYGNEELLSQTWLNLLDNAIKFSPPSAPLLIRLSKTMQSIIVTVRDHGEGMDEITLKRAFEQFYQGETSHSCEGSGLGLSIVRRIVQLHDGELSISSSLGQGTTVTVSFPRLREQPCTNIATPHALR